MQGEAVQPRDAGSAVSWLQHLGRAGADRGGCARVLRESAAHSSEAPDAHGRRARLHPPRAERDNAVGRRSAAGEARHGAVEAGHRADVLHSRRAYHGAALRGRATAPRGTAPPRGSRQHGSRHRAQPRRHQDRRLDHRPRAGRGRPRRDGRGCRRAGAGCGGGCVVHRPVPASPAEAFAPPQGRLIAMVSLLDIIGPVMVGPSSSHTAGACRLGLLARCLVGGTPERARVELHGSFARTGEGHGTDKAIVGGLMGFRPDDERIREALGIAEREGLDYRFEKAALGEENEVHPNTVRITVERVDRTSVMVGSSLGAGRVLVTEIDGYPVEVTGNYNTIVLVAEDIPGSVARIATILADDGINIATLRLTRKERGGDAFMVIEVDEPTDEKVRADIRTLSWVRWAFRLDKVGA